MIVYDIVIIYYSSFTQQGKDGVDGTPGLDGNQVKTYYLHTSVHQTHSYLHKVASPACHNYCSLPIILTFRVHQDGKVLLELGDHQDLQVQSDFQEDLR